MPQGTPPAHVRVSLIGDLNGAERFTCTFALKGIQDAGPDPSPVEAIGTDELGASPMGQRVRDAAVAFWGAGNAFIHPAAVLKTVKLAPIGADGIYLGASKEYAVNVPGGNDVGGLLPNQIARKVTLESDGDLGRVKGGFYLPGVTGQGLDVQTQLVNSSTVENVRTAVKTMFETIEDDPTVGNTFWKVVIASGGRHNDDGTVRRPPTLHDVTGVSIGRRLDVQRRRANKIGEVRTSLATF